ncbi:uncharacterized protein LOC122664664 [Telopea speciosissima]|uniref:uncharacterized protein LOC122664664 n=1 Tax=Telopea speciosissima TaxID=54955 RepID=UPI001CC50174|nr:uncharacterized protein LOC122664664 [Telopea speciosissima]
MLREQTLKLDMEALEAKMEHAVKREVELEEELKACRTRCMELEEKSRIAEQGSRVLLVELECVKKDCISFEDKLGALEIDKISIEDDLKKHKRLCDELKEKFTCLQEDCKVVCEREKRAQERVSILSEELKKVENETREKYVQLKVENIDLMRAKKKAEDEIETWKKRFVELESRVIRLEEDTLVLTVKDPPLSLSMKLDAESRDMLNTISHVDKEKNEASNATKSPEEANGLGNCASLVHPKVKNKRLNCDAGANLHANVGSPCLSLDKESRDVQATGLPCICMPHEPLVKVKEEDNISSETELQHGLGVRRQLEFGQEGSTNKKMVGSNPGSGRPVSGGVIEIVDSDDETSVMNIVAVATPNIRDKGKAPVSVDNSLKGVLKDEKEVTSENCLKRLDTNQRGEENWNSSKEPYELTSTPKRKRASNIITSGSESDNDEDKIPISKLKLKKLQDLTHEPTSSPVNRCSMTPIVSSGDGNVEESFTPSKRRLVTLRQCEERKNGLERISQGHLGRNESDGEYQVMAGPAADNTQDHECEDVGSDTEGESLDGFIVDGEDGEDTTSESEDVGDDDLNYDQVISMIRRDRKNKSGWTFEADMLSSFQKDPELCMKAVCALYRQQTAEEKSVKGSLYMNNRGFSKFDAIRGTNLAEFLLDGDPMGELKKTVEELEKHMSGGLDECRRLASHYSKQLFKIYQNKEDPFFHS